MEISDRSQLLLNPKLVQMLQLKQHYILNPKAAQSNLVGQLNCPDFPRGFVDQHLA